MRYRTAFSLVVSLVVVGLTTTVKARDGERSSSDVQYVLTSDAATPEHGPTCVVADEIECGDCCGNGSLWTVKAGAVILTRSQPRATPLVVDTVGGNTVLDASDFNFNWAGGVDVAVIRQWTDCDAFEVRFFAVDGWSAQDAFTSPAIWNFPTNPPLFGLGVADINAVYTSRLYSTELNWRRQTCEWLTVLAGFRWIEFHEELDVNAEFGGNSAVVFTDASNHLYGGQLGLDARVWNHNRLTVDAYTKAGIYYNSADQDFGVVQAIGPDFASRGQLDSAAFVGEIGASLGYCVTDRLTLRIGYQLLWLESVAIAADQFAATDILAGNGINVDGGAFFHGATTGMEYAW